MPFLNQRKEKRKYVARPGIEPGRLALEYDALPTALRGLASHVVFPLIKCSLDPCIKGINKNYIFNEVVNKLPIKSNTYQQGGKALSE